MKRSEMSATAAPRERRLHGSADADRWRGGSAARQRGIGDYEPTWRGSVTAPGGGVTVTGSL